MFDDSRIEQSNVVDWRIDAAYRQASALAFAIPMVSGICVRLISCHPPS